MVEEGILPQEKVLVVDNDRSLLDMVAGVLRPLGYAVMVAASGQEAMSSVEREGFDLVMVGEAVPGLDAAALVRASRAINRSASAVVMTGRGSAGMEQTGASVESRVFLAKPFDERTLKAVVSQALDKRDVSAEGLRLRTLMPLFEVSSALMAEVNLERLFDLIIDIVRRETKADRVSLMLLDDSSQRLSIEAAVGLPGEIVRSTRAVVGEGIAGSVAQSGEAILLNGVVNHGWMGEGGPITSAICVPLKVKGRVIGVLNSSNVVREGSFSRSDLDMMSILAGQAAIAIENARLFEEVGAKQATLEHLLGELLRAQEEERQRISTEIHDSVAQLMVSASYHTQSSSALLGQSKFERAREEAEYATKIIGKCVKELRGIVAEMYPPALSELGLLGALQENVEYFRRETGVACHVSGAALPEQLSPVQEMVIYRVVQEALNNVRKHAQASEVEIGLRTEAKEISVEIRDNGKGFEFGGGRRARPRSGGVGLLNMRSRAQMLGGDLDIETRPGAGTRVVLTIPLSSPDNLSRSSQPLVKGGSG